jgi:hypothetical protein
VLGGEDKKENRGVDIIKVGYIHVWKFHNRIPHFMQIIYTNKDNFKKEIEILIYFRIKYIF